MNFSKHYISEQFFLPSLFGKMQELLLGMQMQDIEACLTTTSREQLDYGKSIQVKSRVHNIAYLYFLCIALFATRTETPKELFELLKIKRTDLFSKSEGCTRLNLFQNTKVHKAEPFSKMAHKAEPFS